MSLNRRTIVRPSDIIIFDFGSNTIRSAAKGRKPAYVVSVTDTRIPGTRMMVIPLYRNPSRINPEADVYIKSAICPSITRDMYLNPGNITRVERYRAVRRIAHLDHKETLDQIRRAIGREVGCSK